MERAELKPGEYQCCLCGGVFEFGWTDEDAEAELKKNFGKERDLEDGIACDDCYRKFMGETFN
jgi:hypothetical protein